MITATQLAANSMELPQNCTGSIDTIHLADDAVTTAKITDNAIDSELFNSVVTARIADNAITSAKIAANTIGIQK